MSKSVLKSQSYTYVYIDVETSHDASTGAAVGGAIGGTILLILLIALCILLQCVINSRKKKKTKYLISTNVHFMKASSNSRRYISESLNIKFTEANSEVNERICK